MLMDNVPAHISAAALYTGVLILMGIVLQFRVIGIRRAKKIGIGDGKDPELARAIRVHANFAENVPFALAGMVMLALIGAPASVIHGVGILTVFGRALHAVGLTSSAGSSVGRVGGMMMTFSALIITALALIVRAIW
ncbi:MAG: MAPEG family protein [Hyphomicrobiales bacterium]|nr:MAPEG family protein [Hyphomicrobiales bacterium]